MHWAKNKISTNSVFIKRRWGYHTITATFCNVC